MLNPSALSALLAPQLISSLQATSPEAQQALQTLADTLSSTIINYLVANAQVSPLPALISPGGLSPAPVQGLGSIL